MRDAVLIRAVLIRAVLIRAVLIRAVLIRRLAVFGSSLCGVLLVASASIADAPPTGSAQASSAAEARFEGGVTAYEEGRFRDAIELFKEADQLSPSARLSFNIAKVYERMGDNRNALAAYRDYLRRMPAAENEVEVSERIRDLESSLTKLGVQQLSVLSVPGGATLLIDDVSTGVTPWTGELPPGPHRLALRLHDYQEAALDVELPATRAIDVSVALTPLSATRAPAVAGAPSGAHTPSAAAAEPPLVMADAPASLPSLRTWALFGGAAAACAGALAFEISRRDMEDRARSPVQIVHQEKFEAMERRQTAARVFSSVGLLGVVAASVSLYLDLEASSADAPALAMDCDVLGCRVLGGGRF